MQPFEKKLKTAALQARPWKQELNRLLLQYRTNPLCTTVTRISPLELLFNRVVKEKIRVINKKVRHSETRHNEIKRKEHNREYANQRRNARKSKKKGWRLRPCKTIEEKYVECKF